MDELLYLCTFWTQTPPVGDKAKDINSVSSQGYTPGVYPRQWKMIGAAMEAQIDQETCLNTAALPHNHLTFDLSSRRANHSPTPVGLMDGRVFQSHPVAAVNTSTASLKLALS
ncbi:hypothetical protein Bbelb_273840 [Branchiostoma belcheri]|nr:hypothetical protein Bbelb_273840 [Branchiostoma belcheri]